MKCMDCGMFENTSSAPPPAVLAMLARAALAKKLRRGRREAVLARLEEMGLDLFPDCRDFFAAFFHSGEAAAFRGDPRDIGDAFLRQTFADVEARRMRGSFYTPEAIIDRILDLVWEKLTTDSGDPAKDARLCDPAMGCGYFLLRIAERFRERSPGDVGRIRSWARYGLYGVDRDPVAVFLARAFLWLVLSDESGEFVPDPRHFPCGDSLLGPAFFQERNGAGDGDGLDWKAAFPSIASKGGFSCIVGNPPYEVLTNFNRYPERRQLAEKLRSSGYYRESVAGQLNLYRCFVERSLDLLRPGGMLSMIVPLSLARDAVALPLRKRLIEREATADWLLFGEKDRLFADVTQSACIFGATAAGGGCEKVKVTVKGETNEWTREKLAFFGGGDPMLPVMSGEEAKLWEWLWTNCPARIGDIADMRVGEVDQTLFRDCMRDNDTGCLLARGAHLTAFCLNVDAVPGKERFLDLPLFLSKKGASADACRKRASVWRVAQLGIRNMHSLPRLIAALAPPDVYFGNSLNVYSPHAGTPIEYIAGLLNSRLLDWLFRMGSGNNNINLYEMRRLPFPSKPSDRHMQAVVSAYRTCAEEVGQADALAVARENLDRAVEVCYGVPDALLRSIL